MSPNELVDLQQVGKLLGWLYPDEPFLLSDLHEGSFVHDARLWIDAVQKKLRGRATEEVGQTGTSEKKYLNVDEASEYIQMSKSTL